MLTVGKIHHLGVQVDTSGSVVIAFGSDWQTQQASVRSPEAAAAIARDDGARYNIE